MKTITSETLARVEDLLKALGEVRYRSLFGGYSLTIDKAAFGMLVEGELFYGLMSKAPLTLPNVIHRS